MYGLLDQTGSHPVSREVPALRQMRECVFACFQGFLVDLGLLCWRESLCVQTDRRVVRWDTKLFWSVWSKRIVKGVLGLRLRLFCVLNRETIQGV